MRFLCFLMFFFLFFFFLCIASGSHTALRPAKSLITYNVDVALDQPYTILDGTAGFLYNYI